MRVGVGLVLGLNVVSHAYQMRYIGVSSFSSFYDDDDSGKSMTEISGLCSIPSSQTSGENGSGEDTMDIKLLGIGDVLENNKPVWELRNRIKGYNANFSGAGVVKADGTFTLKDDESAGLEGSDLDTEGIAYLKSTDDMEFILISTEGHRQYSTANRLLMYSRDLSEDENSFEFWTELDQNTTVYDIGDGIGTQNNGAFESLDSLCEETNSTECTVVYASESPVYQDLDTCDLCIRISVNTLDMSNMADPKLTQTHQLLYEMDQSGSDYEWVGLVDIAYIGDGTNNALLMERAVASNNVNMRVRIYLADLSMQSDSDVSECFSLDENDQCEAKVPISKTRLFDVSTDKDAEDDSSFTGISTTNFEALTRSVVQNKSHGGRFFVAGSDNGDFFSTYYMTLELTPDFFDTTNESSRVYFDSRSLFLVLFFSTLLMVFF